MTAEEERNVEILREGYRLWHESRAESSDYWMKLMADDVHWRSLGGGAAGSEFTRECSGKPLVQKYFEEMGSQWEMLGYDANEFIAQGDRVVMLGACRWRHRKTGKVVDSPKADVLRMRDGKLVDFMEFYDTAQAIAATT
ncbi:nuclear transport factor 2 family protein [Variovorax robiniae]|uniref:Nuclear transport factor 2 family protein n=1 Tax=Variovorax robiniae TaxID=1836199 RepID=A0ABU8XAJ5_9BURK